MSNRLIASFLEDTEHQKLYSDYLQNPSQEKKDFLEEQFKNFVIKIKAISYFSKVLYFEAQRFDKRLRDNSKRGILILDNEEINDDIQFNESNNMLLETVEQFLGDTNIEDFILDEKLFDIVSTLSDKNKELLNLLFVSDLDEKEIAIQLGISQQAVNKRKNSILTKIRKLYLNQ